MWCVIEYSTYCDPQVRSQHYFKFMAELECWLYEIFSHPWSMYQVEKRIC